VSRSSGPRGLHRAVGQGTRLCQPYTDVLPGGWLGYLIIETAASQIQAYQPQLVPDLSQTQEYARAVIGADPVVPTGAQGLVLEAMLTRQ
jgi:hypothetical protein